MYSKRPEYTGECQSCYFSILKVEKTGKGHSWPWEFSPTNCWVHKLGSTRRYFCAVHAAITVGMTQRCDVILQQGTSLSLSRNFITRKEEFVDRENSNMAVVLTTFQIRT